MKQFFNLIGSAIKRCRIYVLSIFLTYCISCFAGIIMSTNGNDFALAIRDKIVGKAMESDKAAINYHEGNNLQAAVYDFSGNLFKVAIPQSIMGFGIVIPYFSVTIQGWIGGIVSVDSGHKSRFKNFKSTFYYLLVLLLQFIPFSLVIGAGIKCGVDFYKDNVKYNWAFTKYRFRKQSLTDFGLVYIPAVVLFFIASCFEFMSGWNV